MKTGRSSSPGPASLVVLAALLLLAVLLVPALHSGNLSMILDAVANREGDSSTAELLARLRISDGYSLGIYADDIANPRMLHRTGQGRLLVSSPRSGEVLQLDDADGDGFAESRQVLLSGLSRPHGLDRYDGYLYVAESNRIGRIRYRDGPGQVAGDYEVVVDGLTDNGNHWSKTLRFAADGWMYVAMGSTCNVCEEEDERRATIMRFQADGSDATIYATGLRNSVGMDFAPWDGALYATDNGRDWLGDDFPPCELNRIEQGAFYGWPYLNGDNRPDPDFGTGAAQRQDSAIKPVFKFNAHTAPLGILFEAAPRRSALVALHGSWNRSIPDGYKVVRLHWDAAGQINSSDFLWGFEESGDRVGRPVDIAHDGQGGYFVSDDYARVIYRIGRQPAVPRPGEGAVLNSTPARQPPPAASPQPAAAAADASAVRAGGQLYDRLACGVCHAPTSPTPLPLAGLASRYDAQSLSDFFLSPTPPMPLYDLTLQQRLQLAHFLLSGD